MMHQEEIGLLPIPMSAISYNPHAISSFQFPPSCFSDWGVINSAMSKQACFNSGGEQFFFWEPTSVLDLATSPSGAHDRINSFQSVPTAQESIEIAASMQTLLSYRQSGPAYTQDAVFWEREFAQKQPAPLILRTKERDCFENEVVYGDNVSMSTMVEEKSVLESLYQGFEVEEEGVVPSKAFGELPIPFFEDGIDAMDSLGTVQNSCSPSNPSDIAGSCSSTSLNSLGHLSTEFLREMEAEYPSCEFEAVLGLQEPPLAQNDLLQILVKCSEALFEGQHSLVQSMLAELKEFSSPFGDPLQRISFYASEALKKHIVNDVSTGENRQQSSFSQLEHDLAYQAFYQVLPYHKFLHFTGNQVILEAVGDASYVHIIDLDVRQGLQWPSFIQSLALRPGGAPKLLKLTAIGKDAGSLNQTGRRLHEFAQSLGIPFVFQSVTVEIENLDESVFNIEAHETVAVNCSVVLNRLLYKPGKIHGLLALLKKMKPAVLTVMEIESNQNMPSPISRFLQCLVFYRAVLHSIEASLDRNSPDRVLIERVCIAPNISNVLMNDRREEELRYACIDSWRKFLRHSGFKDFPLSHYSQCQANLLLGLYSNDSFKLHQDGFVITLAWQDTPIVSVSAWTC